jgi:sterol 14-demethylase
MNQWISWFLIYFQLLKYSLTQDKLESYVPIFLGEMQNYVENVECFQGDSGTFDVVENVAVMTIFTAAASLQGREVRENLDKDLADLYHDLDKSFIPINFYLPGLPLPVNRKRDEARTKIAAIYSNIINRRRELGAEKKDEAEDDMIWSLMRSTYKDGTPVPDHEIANMMIGLLMAGQHNSYSVASWILLRLATRPDIQEELYQEQLQVFGSDLNLESSANRDTLGRLPLHKAVVRETLRLHAPIHTVMRAIKSPLHVTSKDPQTLSDRAYRIPTSHVLISAPGVTALSEEFFGDPEEWDPRRWEAMDELAAAGENPEPGQKTLSKGAASFYLPFGAGRHRCVGEVFSYLQLSILTSYMVRNFKLHPLPGTEGIPATDYSAMITRPVAPARLLWERRSKS